MIPSNRLIDDKLPLIFTWHELNVRKQRLLALEQLGVSGNRFANFFAMCT